MPRKKITRRRVNDPTIDSALRDLYDEVEKLQVSNENPYLSGQTPPEGTLLLTENADGQTTLAGYTSTGWMVDINSNFQPIGTKGFIAAEGVQGRSGIAVKGEALKYNEKKEVHIGSTTKSKILLKNSSGILKVRNADDSADAIVIAKRVKVSGDTTDSDELGDIGFSTITDVFRMHGFALQLDYASHRAFTHTASCVTEDGSTTITCSANASIAVGQWLTGTGIPKSGTAVTVRTVDVAGAVTSFTIGRTGTDGADVALNADDDGTNTLTFYHKSDSKFLAQGSAGDSVFAIIDRGISNWYIGTDYSQGTVNGSAVYQNDQPLVIGGGNAPGGSQRLKLDISGNLTLTGGLTSAGVHAITSTTSPQFKINYDATNYAQFEVSSGGDLEIETVGAGTTDSDIVLNADGDISLNADDIVFIRSNGEYTKFAFDTTNEQFKIYYGSQVGTFAMDADSNLEIWNYSSSNNGYIALSSEGYLKLATGLNRMDFYGGGGGATFALGQAFGNFNFATSSTFKLLSTTNYDLWLEAQGSGKVIINKDYDNTTAATNNPGLHIDYDRVGAVTSGTDVNTGVDLDVNVTGAGTSGTPTVNTIGIDLDVVGDVAGSGTSDNIGIDISCTGADTNTHLKLSHDSTNYCSFKTVADGVTTIATVDSDGAVGHLNIEPDGHVEFDGCGVGFDKETTTFAAAAVTSEGDDSTDIDFRLGNKHELTLTNNIAGSGEHINMVFPATSGNFILTVVQDATGSRTVHSDGWKAYISDGSTLCGNNLGLNGTDGEVRWAGGTAPTLTTTVKKTDIVSIYWDADNQTACATITHNF